MKEVTPAYSGTQPSRSGGIISSTYQGLEVHFTEDAWFNATEAAARFGRRIDVWLKSQETRDYIAALCEISNTTEKGYLRTRRGRLSFRTATGARDMQAFAGSTLASATRLVRGWLRHPSGWVRTSTA